MSAPVSTGQVVITCSNWRNPILGEIIDGFFIRTMDLETLNHIDETTSLSIDASTFSGGVNIDDTTIAHSITSSFPSDASDITLSFQTD
jgi:hypothetical protein